MNLKKAYNILVDIKDLIIETVKEWLDDNMMMHSAALAFYTIFSLAPLIIIIVAVSGLFFGEQASQGQLSHYMEEIFGADLSKTIENFVSSVYDNQAGFAATLIGGGILLFAATTVVTQLKESLNTVWNIKTREGKGFYAFLVNRLLALLLILIFSFTLGATIIVDAVLAIMESAVDPVLPGSLQVWNALSPIFYLLVTTILFAIMYKMLPDINVKWTDVLVGALVTAVLFWLGRNAVTYYLMNTATNSTYGAAGSFVIFLIWVYYNMMMIFLGAEFTRVYTQRYGSKLSAKRFGELLKFD